MKRSHLPAEIELTAGTENGISVRFDYDPGEDSSWNGLTGVGHPGCPPSVEITEVCIDGCWGTPDQFPQLDIDACEQELHEKIIEIESVIFAEQAEAEYQAWQDAKQYAKEME